MDDIRKNTVVKIGFHGGELEAVKQGDDIYVSVRRACEHLGIAPNGQIEKLKEKEWACSKIILSHDTTGRNQEAFMLHIDSLPMWLATIDASRVTERARPLLIAYQKEAAQVLRDYFIYGGCRIPKTLSEALHLAGDLAAKNERLLASNIEAENKIVQMRPDAEYGKALSRAGGGRLIGTFSKAFAIDGKRISPQKMFEYMRRKKLLIPAFGARKNEPYEKYIRLDWFRIKTGKRERYGETVATSTTVITPKGEQAVINLMINDPEFYGMSITFNRKKVSVPEQMNLPIQS